MNRMLPHLPPEALAAQAVSVSVAGWRDVVAEGTGERINVVVTDAAGNALAGRRITWTSTAAVIAGVTAEGELRAFSPGQARLTAACGSAAATLPLTVEADPVAGITVRPNGAAVAAGSELQLDAFVSDLDGTRLDDRVLLWSSSDPNIARVVPTGRVRGIAAGEAAIVASTGGKTAAVKLTVTGIAPPAPSGASRATRAGVTPVSTRASTGMRASTRASARTPARTATRVAAGSSAQPPETKPSRRRAVIIAATALIALASVGGAAVLWNGSPSTVPTDSSGASILPADEPADAPATMQQPDPVPDDAAEPQAVVAGTGSDAAASDAAQAGAQAEPPRAGTVGIAGDLPAGAVITIRDSNGRARTVTGRSVSLTPGTYILEARAAGYESHEQAIIVGPGTLETWTPRLRPVAAPVTPDPVATQPEREPQPEPPPPVIDTSADEAAVTALVRDFVAAFNARTSEVVVPLLPSRRRAAYSAMLPDTRNVSAFSVRLTDMQPVAVRGDVAEVDFDIVVSFRNNLNQDNSVPHRFTGRAERTANGWRLISLQDR